MHWFLFFYIKPHIKFMMFISNILFLFFLSFVRYLKKKMFTNLFCWESFPETSPWPKFFCLIFMNIKNIEIFLSNIVYALKFLHCIKVKDICFFFCFSLKEDFICSHRLHLVMAKEWIDQNTVSATAIIKINFSKEQC